jgi:putative ABC transport system permease protein
MRFPNRLRAPAAVVIKRVTSQPWLMVATIAGLVVAIGLMMSIPIYADAVYRRTFLLSLASRGAAMDESTESSRVPPFAYDFRYDGSIYGAKEWSRIQPVSAYLTDEGPRSLGMPLQYVARYATTEPFGLYVYTGPTLDSTVPPLMWASFAFVSGIEDHITVTEGRLPWVIEIGSPDPVEAMIHEDLAVTLGAQVGEVFSINVQTQSEGELLRSIQIPVRLVGT